MRARERSEALLLTMADGRGRKAKAARCARALIRRFSPPSPASQEKGWGVGLSGAKAQPGLATAPRSHKKLPGHRILSHMPDTTPAAIAPRSEARRVGKACVRTFSSRWSPFQ